MKGTYTRITNLRCLLPGDHICIWDYSRWPFSYQHHGIIWKSGDSVDTIEVCHVWSPIEEWREAQEDSCFRISTLKEFLYKRALANVRLVEYHTSSIRELLSSWGEVHYTKSDLPPIVLSRCRFLLGIGKGEFNIFTQNCEHAAHWCMTGEQWCKQTLSMKKGKVPFEKQVTKESIVALERKIEETKQKAIRAMETILEMSGSFVYLKVNGKYYVRADKQTKKVMITTTAPRYVSVIEEKERRYQELKNETILEHDEERKKTLENKIDVTINGTTENPNVDGGDTKQEEEEVKRKLSLEEETVELLTSIRKEEEEIHDMKESITEKDREMKPYIGTIDEKILYDDGEPTLFQLDCYSKGYNCIKVSFYETETKRHMYSRSTLSCLRDIRLKKYNLIRGFHGMTWEYSPFSGYMKSMNQHRRYAGIQPETGRLIDVSMRDMAATFEIVIASEAKQKLVKLPLTRVLSHNELSVGESTIDDG